MTHHPSMATFSTGQSGSVSREGALALAPHYALNYHSGTLNYCPGCAGTQWLIGRMTAQCARCDTAMPLAHMAETPMHPLYVSRSSKTAWRG